MTRPSHVELDLDALRANYQLARRVHGGRALAVIKANAYGHGALAEPEMEPRSTLNQGVCAG